MRTQITVQTTVFIVSAGVGGVGGGVGVVGGDGGGDGGVDGVGVGGLYSDGEGELRSQVFTLLHNGEHQHLEYKILQIYFYEAKCLYSRG